MCYRLFLKLDKEDQFAPLVRGIQVDEIINLAHSFRSNVVPEKLYFNPSSPQYKEVEANLSVLEKTILTSFNGVNKTEDLVKKSSMLQIPITRKLKQWLKQKLLVEV